MCMSDLIQNIALPHPHIVNAQTFRIEAFFLVDSRFRTTPSVSMYHHRMWRRTRQNLDSGAFGHERCIEKYNVWRTKNDRRPSCIQTLKHSPSARAANFSLYGYRLLPPYTCHNTIYYYRITGFQLMHSREDSNFANFIWFIKTAHS